LDEVHDGLAARTVIVAHRHRRHLHLHLDPTIAEGWLLPAHFPLLAAEMNPNGSPNGNRAKNANEGKLATRANKGQ